MSASARSSTWSRSPRCLPRWSSGSRTDRRAVHRTWITGHCWRCDEPDVPVLWLGPVQSLEQGGAPFYCCQPCVRRLEALFSSYPRQSLRLLPREASDLL